MTLSMTARPDVELNLKAAGTSIVFAVTKNDTNPPIAIYTLNAASAEKTVASFLLDLIELYMHDLFLDIDVMPKDSLDKFLNNSLNSEGDSTVLRHDDSRCQIIITHAIPVQKHFYRQ